MKASILFLLISLSLNAVANENCGVFIVDSKVREIISPGGNYFIAELDTKKIHDIAVRILEKKNYTIVQSLKDAQYTVDSISIYTRYTFAFPKITATVPFVENVSRFHSYLEGTSRSKQKGYASYFTKLRAIEKALMEIHPCTYN